MGAWTITFMIGITNRMTVYQICTNSIQRTIFVPNQPYKLNIRIIIYFTKYCTRNRTRTYNCMASKTTAYTNSAIRVFWLNDGNRTHTQSATNFCPTIRLRSTYKRCVLESNQCKRFCRPSPSHSDNSPYCSFSRTRTYTLTFVVLCDNPFHYETICTQ